MGNKRKFISTIQNIITQISTQTSTQTSIQSIAEGFTGSGIVSRLFKNHAQHLYVNDLAGYSKTLSSCYLATPSKSTLDKIRHYIEEANKFADTPHTTPPQWIQQHWAPKNDNDIQPHERAYYTAANAKRIDRYRYFINSLPKKYQPFLLAPLLIECSIHTNTSGQFSAFYKKDNRGHYGGKTETDVKRITTPITIPFPIFSPSPAKITIGQQDANEWIKTIPPVDLLYLDPPYNKHPYSIYYFMLDIINDWDTTQEIPKTLRGQPKNWKRSLYNSTPHAKRMFEDLIKHAKAKYILISYNDGGIIPLIELEKILKAKGEVTKIPVQHNTYNRMIGISNYKRKKEKQMKPKEFLWLIKT